jgi:hypothetical protein
MEIVQIVESRTKVLLLLLGSLVFVALYLFLPDPNHQLPVWGGWFFGVGAAVFVLLVFRPRKLTLDSEGFMVSGGLTRRPSKIAWRDVTGFAPIYAGTKMVGFRYAAETKRRPRGTWLSRRLSGADGAISGAWPCSTTDLAEQLNHYRERALSGS